jgi:hypothetical protein
MHSSKFSLILIAVSGCIAMIGAIPVGNRAGAEAVVRRQDSDSFGDTLECVPLLFAVAARGVF